MDDFSLGFAQEAALRQVDDCTNIAELKALAKSLIKSHFTSRSFIATLLLRDASTPISASYLTELDDELPWRRG
jgi:hypothetical protein